MVKITNIDPNSLALQTFSAEDFLIIPNTIIDSDFNPTVDTVEYFIYDYNNNLLKSNYNLNSFTPIRIDGEGNILEISIDPEKDALSAGYDSGIIKTVYNFIETHLGSDRNNQFYISDISPSRTEIRLGTNNIRNFQFNPDPFKATLTTSQIEESKSELSLFFTEFKNKLTENNRYFDEFYLNFGNNLYVLGVNILLEMDMTNGTMSLLVKLYEPLPTNIGLKSELYIVSKTSESVGFQLEYSSTVTLTDTTNKLAGPNYNIDIKDQTGPITIYKTYNDITATTLSGSFAELLSNISQSSATLNVDYTDYEDFVFFSSANERLTNFRNKLLTISSSQAQLDLLYSSISGPSAGSTVVSSSKNILEKEIQTTITSFDGYEKYLYYDSGSKSWPKSTTTLPYTLVDVNDAVATSWFVTQSLTASVYDNENQNNLEFAIPEYIRYNNSNENYLLYTNMIGQFFDEVWLYTKEITSKLDANSSLYQGISKDLVGTVLESLGTKIYDSTYTLENIYSSLIGLSASGSITPSTGSEYITNYVSSSIDPAEVPTIDDFVKLSYKKIYHSLPYLLKKKGTNEGLRALINIFGVPDTILNISEFGGKDKDNTNDWDRWEHQFNYKYDVTTPSTDYITTSWVLNTSWGTQKPATIQLRFQTPDLDTGIANPNQVLWNLGNIGDTALVLEYTGSGYTSGSYSGSIVDSENQYATLKFIPDYSTAATVSASVYLPFFDGGWWSVMITKQDTNYTLYAANNIYSGSDGSSIGFISSASITGGSETAWNAGTDSYFGSDGNNLVVGGNVYKNFSGSYQEIRYYNTALSASVFEDYTMNPNSIEGNGTNSAPDQLAFRASLGGELYTGSVSIHPKVTGSWTAIPSFASDSTFTINGGEFTSQTDYVFYDQIPAGVKNIVSNKIKQLNTDLPYTGSLSNTTPNTVLSNQIQVQQKVNPSSSYVDDINYLEVAFSPQNEINEDINSSIGYFNIGEYIGDPRLVSSSAESYPALDALRNSYFEKYTHNYNLWDYIRIIRYYDNALFKMVKDYVPARTSLATGIVIKQHILERNKYPVPQVDTYTTTSVQYLNDPFIVQDQIITGSSIVTNTVEGGSAGVMPNLNGEISGSEAGFNYSPITQSWSGFNDTITGPVAYTSSTQHEFFDGELSGSVLVVTNGELNPGCDPYKEVNTDETLYDISGSNWSSIGQFEYYVLYAASGSGEVHLWYTLDSQGTPDIGPGSQDFYDYNYKIKGVAITIPNSKNGTDVYDIIPNVDYIVLDTNYVATDFQRTGTWSPLPSRIVSNVGDVKLKVLTVQLKQAYPGLNSYYLIQTEPSDLTVTWRQNLASSFPPYTTGSFTIANKADATTVFEPYVTPAFQNSDCNAVMNNALVPRVDEFFMDVDYSSNAIVAVNTQQILSSSATPAPVQYSNYTLARQTYPRYFGSKNTSLQLNFYTPPGTYYNDGNITSSVWPGDQSFGKTAAIEQYGAYGVFYNGSGLADEINGGGKGTIYLKPEFLFDQLGQTLQPKSDSPYVWNGQSAFGGGNTLAVTVYNSESVTQETLATLQQPQTSLGAFNYLNTSFTTASGSVDGTIFGGTFWVTSSVIMADQKNQVGSTWPEPYFSVGASSPTVLTASAVVSVGYKEILSGSRNWYQAPPTPTSARGGFDNPTRNILPYIGQKIYFLNMENEFTISNIVISGSSATSGYRWLLTLDKSTAGLSSGDLQHFIFMNYETDTSKIYIDSELSGSAVGKGFIFNENISPEFKSGFDAIIKDFKSKALI